MRVAVTGATGFLGRHVVPALRQRGAEVTVMLRPGGDAGAKPWTKGLAAAAVDLADPPADMLKLLSPAAIARSSCGSSELAA